MKCAVCDNEALKQTYCELHAKAYENIIGKYQLWRKAINISWKGYLSQIAENPLTGECAKQVAQYLITIEEK